MKKLLQFFNQLLLMTELTINVLKQIIERIPEDYIIEVNTGKNTHKLSDQIQINISGKKLIFNKYQWQVYLGSYQL